MNTPNSFARYTPLVALLGLMFFVAGCGTGPDNDAEKLFDSGNIAPGESFSFTFEEEGTVEYFCDIHTPDPGMEGTVTVTSGAEISGRDTVDMVNTQFSPRQITVAPNTEIVWINRDDFAHTVVDGNPQSSSGGYY
ncbi:MAG: plastocyanin/azurin family copper-binding protein [Candidatus Halalkalibacterium sp. M3_1C_030]